MSLVREGTNVFGRAVFATVTIQKGTPLMEMNGDIICFAETHNLPDESFALQTSRDTYLLLPPPLAM